MKKGASAQLINALLCSLVSAGFLVLGCWYPAYLVKVYHEDDFRGGGAMSLALIVGLVYAVRAILSLFHLGGRDQR
jgi:hypothetical protein